MKEKKEFAEEVIQIDRVTRVVKGGRRLRFRATVVIGDRKGQVGVGVGKSTEVAGAIKKAIAKAKRVLIRVPLFKTTIPHDIKIKYKASKILLMPASEGTGIIAGGAIRKVVELAGIKNILSKSFGTNNKLSNTKAAYKALGLLRKRSVPEKYRDKKEDKKEIVAPKSQDKPVAKVTPKKETEKKD
ncbi:30S ribosomal protein S5 [Patescibacteria group bacterium]|nr:30S ribosomal protein S5 [Patescibacteria group bacterium]